ncbi:Serine/threonine-protein phosphatase PP-Z1 [Dirofilaria immitis]
MAESTAKCRNFSQKEIETLIVDLYYMCFLNRIPLKRWFNKREMIALLHNAMEAIFYYDRLYITTVNWSKCNDLMTIGNLNGDLDMLVSIFRDDRWPPNTRAIFLGDYLAPNGEYRYDALVFLLTLKIRFPKYIVLLRGHGETHEMCAITKFDLFCADNELFKAFIMLFNFLPLVVKAGPFLCVHSGVSPYMTSSTPLKTLPKPLGQEKILTSQKSMVADILYGTPDDALISEFAPSNDYPIGFRFNKQGLQKVLQAFGAKRLIRTCRMKNKVGWCYDFDNDPICLSFITAASESDNNEEMDIMRYIEAPLRNRYIIFLLPDGYICDCKVFNDEMAPNDIQMVYQLILPYTFGTSYICRPLGLRQCNISIELDWKMDLRQLQYRLVELSPALLSNRPSELKPLDYAIPNLKITEGPWCSTPIRHRSESKLWDELQNQSLTMIDVDEEEDPNKTLLACSSRITHEHKFENKNLLRSPVRSRSRSFTSGMKNTAKNNKSELSRYYST